MVIAGRFQSGSGHERFAAFPLGFLDELGDAVQAGVHFLCLQFVCDGQGLLNRFRAVAVGQDVEFRTGDEFEVRLFVDHAGEGPGFFDALVDQDFVAFPGQDFQAGVDQHGHARAGAFEGGAAEVS